MKKPTHRIFFAIELNQAVKTKLLGFQDRLLTIDANPIKAENFHITLCFLGNVSEPKIESILDGLNAPSMASFKVSIRHPLYFSSSKIMGLSVDYGKNQLTQLKSHIENQLQTIAHFDLEKQPYKPHVSLFRKVEQLPEHLPVFGQDFPIDSFCLMASVPTKKSVRYEVIEEWRLSKNQSIKESLLGSEF
jgi:2'-5' RNA ligase